MTLPWRDVPLRGRTRATVHAAQAVQVVRRRRTVTTGKVTLERVYGVASLSPHQAEPAELASWVCGHWGIENKIHHVRDTAYTEDAARARTGTAPRAGTSEGTASPPGSVTNEL